MILLTPAMENYHVIDLVGEGSFGKVRPFFSVRFFFVAASSSTHAEFFSLSLFLSPTTISARSIPQRAESTLV